MCAINMKIVILFILSTVSSVKITVHKSDISRCADLGELYSVSDDQCYTPLSRGHCSQGEMIVLSETGVGSCKEDPCPLHEVLVDGNCVGVYGRTTCKGKGLRKKWNIIGEVECGCEEGWGHINPRQGCFQLSSKGPCYGGEIVMESDQSCSRVGMFQSLQLLNEFDNVAQRNAILRLKELNCGVRGRELCCQMLDEGEIEFGTEDVLQAQPFQHTIYQCGPNSTPSGTLCSSSSRPWPSSSSSRCFPLQEGFIDSPRCTLFLTDDWKYINCYEEEHAAPWERTDIRSVVEAAPAKCRKGQFFSDFRNKCVRRYK